MKNLILMTVLALGTCVPGFSQNNQGQNNNNQGQNGRVAMPEGIAVELPCFIMGAGFWLVVQSRRRRKAL
jgi:hypothetical protein